MGEIASYPLSVWQKGPQPATPVSCRTDVAAHLTVEKTTGGSTTAAVHKVPAIQGVSSVKMKRGHVSKACTNCRKMHAGCDLARPCSRCVFHRMEASCVDIPRKKRVSKKKLPGEPGAPDITTAIVVDTKKEALHTAPPAIASRAWKDPYSDLFDSLQLPASLPSTTISSLPVALNPSTAYFPTLADIVGSSDSDSHGSLPHSPSSSPDFLHEDPSLFSSVVVPQQRRKDVVELKEQMDELRQSNVALESRLNNVTQELTEMRQKMQQMLHLLGGFFVSPSSPNDISSSNSSSSLLSGSGDGALLGVPLSQELSDL